MPAQDPDDIYDDPQTIGGDDDQDEEDDGRGDITELREAPDDVSDIDQEDKDGGLEGYDPIDDQEVDSADELD